MTTTTLLTRIALDDALVDEDHAEECGFLDPLDRITCPCTGGGSTSAATATCMSARSAGTGGAARANGRWRWRSTRCSARSP
ncbi:hypothetical protein [Amycolatopsis methanolica]|uniref:hypothetical protein n=1 Tax=Amycolatopsis methanolica TaxID=1814 RepID=UPI003440699C